MQKTISAYTFVTNLFKENKTSKIEYNDIVVPLKTSLTQDMAMMESTR